MNGASPAEDEHRKKWRASLTRWLWMGGSGVATLVGASLALTLFPSAAFGRNPTGQFGWHLVGFALAVGIPFAIYQWLVLRYVLRYREAVNTLVLILWIPVTSLGIAVMILPLWWFDTISFVKVPWLPVMPMLPGIFFLGLGQWLILAQVISARSNWVLLTTIGATIGSILGFQAALLTSVVSEESVGTIEPTWAFVIGTGIGVLQGNELVRDWDTERLLKRVPTWVWIVLGAILILILVVVVPVILFSLAMMWTCAGGDC